MTAAELLARVTRREQDRMMAWLGTWVGIDQAIKSTGHAIKTVWWCASAPMTTEWGPLEKMYMIIQYQLRRHQESRGSYLPVNALSRLVLPTEDERRELCLAYAVLGAACVGAEVNWDERVLLEEVLHQVYVCRPLKHAPKVDHVGSQQTRHVVGRISERLAVMDVDREPASGWLRNVYVHELDRSRRWAASVATGERSY